MADGLLSIDPNDINSLISLFGPSEEDRRRARSFGLLQAGLSLLGTPKGRELQGIGNAGLLGTNAYLGELNDAVKQRGQGITQALGAQNLLRRDKFLRDLDTPTQPQGMPAPSSYSPGVSAAFGLPYTPPAPQQQPQSIRAQAIALGIPDAVIKTAMASADPAAALNKALLEFSQPRAVGNTLYVGNKPVGGMAQRDQVPISSGPDGKLVMNAIPGLQDYFAAGTGADEAAKRKAAAPYETVDVPGVGKMPQSEFIRRYQAETQGPTYAPTMSPQERDIAAQDASGARPLSTVRTPGPATSSLPQYNLGVTTSPLTVEAAKEGIVTGEQNKRKGYETMLQNSQTMYEDLRKGYTASRELVSHVANMRKLDAEGVFSGPVQEWAGKWANAWNSAMPDAQISGQKLANTQTFQSEVGKMQQAIARTFPGQQSDRELLALTASLPNLMLSKEGRAQIFDTIERKSTDAQNMYRSASAHMKSNEGNLIGWEPPAFTPPAAAYGAPPEKPLIKNTTALVKAQQAIKAGAPRAAVRQRLIEQGYDPGDL